MVVFVTAYDQYALEAFRVHAFDYLLKPYEDSRFRETLDRAKEQLSREEAARIGEQLRAKAVEAGLDRPVVPHRGARPRADHLPRGRGESTGSSRPTTTSSCTWARRPTCTASRWPRSRPGSTPARFVRIHRTAIVNLRVLREVRRTGSGGLVAVLSTGAELPVARSQQARIRQLR